MKMLLNLSCKCGTGKKYDRPTLRTAVKSNSDVLITGDKDLLEADITLLRIVTPAEFLNIWEKPVL